MVRFYEPVHQVGIPFVTGHLNVGVCIWCLGSSKGSELKRAYRAIPVLWIVICDECARDLVELGETLADVVLGKGYANRPIGGILAEGKRPRVAIHTPD